LNFVQGIPVENIKKYVVHHFLDTMLIEDKITICKNMFQSVDKHMIDDVLESMVKGAFGKFRNAAFPPKTLHFGQTLHSE
jgi:hypothetical protein